jgi:hypothetical protein
VEWHEAGKASELYLSKVAKLMVDGLEPFPYFPKFADRINNLSGALFVQLLGRRRI